ncbi:MAG: cysteine desulfurase [Fusobacteriaceae bacterium]|nr:cysteine desulfurase [Fusobacteriaceae bacterium]
MIYFDNAATTQIDKRVVDKMTEVLLNNYGNPSSKYYGLALDSIKLLKESRETIAKILGVNSDEIIFNSGASEGNSQVIKGIALYNKNCHIISSKVEHHSSMESLRQVEELGTEVTYLDVNKTGQINPEDLKNVIKENTKLVSLIAVNNEIGTMNDIEEVSKICSEKKVLLHLDVTQLVSKEKLNFSKANVDYLTFSAHKFYGAKGVGALYMKRNSYGLVPDFYPLISGSQEDDLRGGTYCLHNIVGMAEALRVITEDYNTYKEHMKKLDSHFLSRINDLNIILNGFNKNNRILGIFNLRLPGVNNEIFIKENSNNFAISTGSACSLNSPSHVLEAIGLNKFEIRNSIRVSLGKYNTIDEIDKFFEVVKRYI